MPEMEALLQCVLLRTPEELEEQLCRINWREAATAFPGGLPKLEERLLRILQREIMVEYPYAREYIPLHMLCTLSQPLPQTRIDDMSRFRTNLRVLQRKLLKFRLCSKHPLVQNVWYYTLMHIEQNCKLQGMAKRFYVNKNYLSVLFHQETGIYYKDFVLQFRIERAKLLLLSGDLKVHNIAEQLNFSDPEYFRRVFRNRVGSPPSKYTFADYLDQE